MVLFAFLIGLFLFVSILMPWFNSHAISKLQDEIKSLKKELAFSSKTAVSEKTLEPEPEIEVEDVNPKAVAASHNIPRVKEAAQQSEESRTQKPKKQISFEENFVTKIAVWIGAAALIFGAFYLVKYSIENQLLSPIVRVILAGIFGGVLIASGHWVFKTNRLENSLRISQALIGAGIVSLYAGIYAATNLYNFIGPVTGFLGMSAVTFLGVVFSVRCGQPLAFLAMMGGVLTPVFIGSNEPNTVMLFAYLYVLFTALLFIFARQGWWMLITVAAVSMYSWCFVWLFFMFGSAEYVYLVFFMLAITISILIATQKFITQDKSDLPEAKQVHFLNYFVIGAALAAVYLLSFKITLGLFDWSVIGLMSLALMVMTYFKARIYDTALWLKLISTMLLFFLWAEDVSAFEVLLVTAGFSLIYIGVPAYFMRRVSDPRRWALLQVVFACAVFAISFFVIDVPFRVFDSIEMFWGIVALNLASLSVYQASDIKRNFNADDDIKKHLIAIYAFAASAFITMGLTIELPFGYLPLAIAGQIFATSLLYKNTGIAFLKMIMAILACLFLALNYELFVLFIELATRAVIFESMPMHLIGKFMIDMPFVKLSSSALLLGLSFYIVFIKDQKQESVILHILFGAMTACLGAFAYLLLRTDFTALDFSTLTLDANFIDRGIVSLATMAASALFIYYAGDVKLGFLKKWAVIAFHLCVLRVLYFDFFGYNPYFSYDQTVGEMPLLNGITLTYGGLGIALWWAIKNKDEFYLKAGHCNLYKALGFVSLLTFVSLSIRHFYQGGFVGQALATSSMELYTYSIAWLLVGAAMLLYGVLHQNKTARIGSLGFILLAVFKVFIVDAAELEGLYRVFSLMGLGLSLIGISALYSRYVFKK